MKKLLTATCILGFSLCIFTDSAYAYGFKKLNITDADFQDKIKTGEWSESWVAQGRVGDAASGKSPNTTYEVNVDDVTTDCSSGECVQTFQSSPASQSQFQWQNGKTYDFSVDFTSTGDADGNSANGVGSVTMKVEGANPPPAQSTTVTLNDVMDTDEKINSLLVRVVAPSTGSSSVTIGEKLEISDDGFMDLANYGDKLVANSGSNPRDVKYLQITGITGDFSLDGEAIFEWAGLTNLPKNSELAFQIKGMFIPEKDTAPEVPEPSTLSLLSIGLLAMAGIRDKSNLVK